MTKSAFQLLVAIAFISSVRADAAPACSPAQLQALESAAANVAGILAACERDTGFRLFPFTELPATTEQHNHVCLGRSCPTAISSLQDANLPDCVLSAVKGTTGVTLTPAAFLERVCKVAADH